MQTVMLQFKHQGPAPLIDDVCRMFGLRINEIDSQFGVIATDPAEGIYTVLVDAKASKGVEAILANRSPNPAEGIFANSRIGPLVPPEK